MHQDKVHRHPSIIEQFLVFALHNSLAPPCLLFRGICCNRFRIHKLCHMPFKHGNPLAFFFRNFHSICTVRSCKPRRGAFNKGGSQTDDMQILRSDLGSKSHGDSLCSGACFEPALTLWFCWSHLCQVWAWKPWASRIPDQCPSCPLRRCSFGARVLPSRSSFSCRTWQLQGRVETQHLHALAALALLASIVENETLLWLHFRLKHHEGSATIFLHSFPAVALLTIYTDHDDTWSRCVEHDRSFRSVHRSGNRKERFTLTRTTKQWHACTKLRSERSIGRHCTVPHVFTVSNELSVVRAQELNRV